MTTDDPLKPNSPGKPLDPNLRKEFGRRLKPKNPRARSASDDEDMVVKTKKNSGYPDTSLLCDLRGNNELKKEIDDIYLQMANRDLYCLGGIQPDKSYLFYGPAGTGKTLGVRCLYGELLSHKKSFGLMEYSIGNYGTAYINMGSKNLQEFFDSGQSAIEKGVEGMIYFFDECDVLLGKRGSAQGHKEDDKLLDTLMTNLQEIHDRDTSEFVFFATNFRDAMDNASMRAQRIDKQVEFKLPDYNGRADLFKHAILMTQVKAGRSVVRAYNLNELAEKSDGLNCAECVDLVRRAIKSRINTMLHSGDDVFKDFFVKQYHILDELEILKKTKIKEKKIGFK
ncbi:MAG: ATP-binding protein [Nanoarchaeota archaeon]|nr:ATP-binding protein [Nanoarchaeota archaeon]